MYIRYCKYVVMYVICMYEYIIILIVFFDIKIFIYLKFGKSNNVDNIWFYLDLKLVVWLL